MTNALERVFDNAVFIGYGLVVLWLFFWTDLVHRLRHGGRGMF